MNREEFLNVLNLTEIWGKPEKTNKKRIVLWDKECIVKEQLLGRSRRIDVKCDFITLQWRSTSGVKIKKSLSA